MMENGKPNSPEAEASEQAAEPGADAPAAGETVDNLHDLAEAMAEQAAAEPAPAELDPMEQLVTENADMKDRMYRLAAELENLRRRSEREKDELRRYAATRFARDIISVSDNMDRALEAVSQEAREAADEVTRNLLEGIEMVRRELLSTFEKHDIRRIEPVGEKFDPNLHQAMFEIPNTEVASGTILQVMQPGYVISDRVLRPAMVGVSKGGPKVADEADNGAEPAPCPPAAGEDTQAQ